MYLESYLGLFDTKQFGFRRKRSTVLQMVDSLDRCMHDINAGRPAIDAIYIDFKAALYIVNHRFLLSKLRCFGISDSLISWFASFLENRTFAVRLGGVTSE